MLMPPLQSGIGLEQALAVDGGLLQAHHLRFLQLHALTPAPTIADLCTLRSTKLCAQDFLHGLAHLRLEPQCYSSGNLLRAFQDQLVVYREQKVGTGAGIRCQLLQGEVEDVSGSGLNRSIEPFGVFRLVVLIRGDHTTPPQGTPGLPFSPRPVGLLPPVEVRKGSPECFAILDPLPSVGSLSDSSTAMCS